MSTGKTTFSLDHASPLFKSLEELREAHEDLMRRRRAVGDMRDSSGVPPELLADINALIARGCNTGALLAVESERYTAQSILNYWATFLYRVGQDSSDATLAEYDESQVPLLVDAECPYSAENQCFVAWKRLVDECLEKLSHDRVVAVLGSPGSGRSALVRGELLLALRAAGLPGSENWRYLPVFTPGSQPIETLAKLLHPADASPGEVSTEVQRIKNDPARLAQVLDESSQTCVVIVDQFEQVYTLCDAQQRTAFVANLIGLLREAAGEHYLILAVRSDFLSHLSELEELYGTLELEHNRVLISFTTRELRQAIEAPARTIGLKFDDGLVDRLLLDVQGDPAPLALMEFILLNLWDHRERNRITWAAYKKVGGGALALDRTAEALYRSLTPADRDTMRQILLRMIRLGLGREVTLVSARLAQLSSGDESAGDVARLLDRFVQARLVRRVQSDESDEVQYRLIHDALVEHWPKLAQWVEDKRLDTRQRRRLTAAAQQWDERGESFDAMWSGALLQEAREYEDLDELETRFVRASRRLELRVCRRRWISIGTIAILLGIIAATVFITWKGASELASRRLETATYMMESGDLGVSLALFLEASETDPRYRLRLGNAREVYQMRLGAGLRQHPVLDRVFFPPPDTASRFSKDGKRVLLTVPEWDKDNGKTKEATLYQAKLGNRLDGSTVDFPHGDKAHDLWWSDNGSWLIVARGDGAELWSEGREEGPLQKFLPKRRITGVFFDPHSEPMHPRFVTFSEESGKENEGVTSAHLWTWNDPNLEVHTPLFSAKAVDSPEVERIKLAAKHVSFGARGLVAVATHKGTEDGEVLVWDTQAEKLSRLLHRAMWTAFSPDGKLLLTISEEDEKGRIWEIEEGVFAEKDHERTRVHLVLPHPKVGFGVFSPDSRHVATAGDDGSVRLWDATTGLQVIPQIEHDKKVFQVSFSEDSRYLATASRDRTARVWEAATGKPVTPPLHHQHSVTVARFSDDCRQLFTRDEDMLAVWDLAGGNPPSRVLATEGQGNHAVEHAACSPDGTLVVTASAALDSDRGVAHVWDAQDGKPKSKELLHDDGPVIYASFSHNGEKVVTVSQNSKETSILRIWDVNNLDDPPLEVDFELNPVADSRPEAGLAPEWDIQPVSKRGFGKLLFAAQRDGFLPPPDAFPEGFQEQPQAINDKDKPRFKRDFKTAFMSEKVEEKKKLQLIVTAGGSDNLAHVWKLVDVHERAEGGVRCITAVSFGEPLQHDNPVTHAAFDSVGKHLVTTSQTDDYAWVWKIPAGTDDKRQRIGVAEGGPRQRKHKADVVHASFSQDGQSVITSSLDGEARVWTQTWGGSWSITQTFRHSQGVTHAWFGEGGFAITTSLDDTARVWDPESEQIITILHHHGSVEAARFQASSERLVTVALLPTIAYAGIEGSTGTESHVAQMSIWQMSAYRGSVDEIRTMTEFMAARTVDEPSASETLDPAREQSKREARLRELKECFKAFKDWQSSGQASHLSQTATCEATGKWFAADWHLRKVLETEHRDNPQLWHRLAKANEKLAEANADPGRRTAAVHYYEEAIECYKKALEIENKVEWLEDRAMCYLRLSEWQSGTEQRKSSQGKAVNDFNNASKMEPARWQFYWNRATAYAAEGKSWEKVAKDLEEVVRRRSEQLAEGKKPDVEDSRIWYQLAVAYLKRKNFEAYQATCARMLEHFGEHPDNPTVANNVAWTVLLHPRSGIDPSRAIDLARWALAKDPGMSNALNTLGLALYRSATIGDGTFESVVKRLEDSQKAQNYIQHRDWNQLMAQDGVLGELFKAMTLERSDGVVWDWIMLAMAYAQQAKFDEAKWETAQFWRNMAVAKIEFLEKKQESPEFAVHWATHLELELLGDEMEELFKEKSATSRSDNVLIHE